MSKRVTARINLAALVNNCQQIQTIAPHSNILAMVKADAYGHGESEVANVLEPYVAGFGVATLEEAEALRDAGINSSIVLLEGFNFPHELAIADELRLDLVIHHRDQLELLLSSSFNAVPKVWLKLDSGMHRLGFSMESWPAALERLRETRFSASAICMSHLACADEPDHALNEQQVSAFQSVVEGLPNAKSIANSAAILSRPDLHFQWIRPGIMLYGVSPFGVQRVLSDYEPVMTLLASVIAIRKVEVGDAIGYGASYVCSQAKRIATVSIGYGDGYPRAAVSGTPCFINGQRCEIVGRVSMDMITVDVSEVADVQLGDQVELWGENIRVEEVAEFCGTIAYELLTGLTGRVNYQYLRPPQ